MLHLVGGVCVRPLLFKPFSELLVWLVVCRDVEDGGKRDVCEETRLLDETGLNTTG